MRRLRNPLAALALCAVALSWAGAARAKNCRNLSATTLAFGAYDVFSASPNDTTGNINFSCSANTPVHIELSAGNSGSYRPMRAMAGPAQLKYNIYQDAARTTIWGIALDGLDVGGSAAPIPFYGRIPAGFDVPVGSYSDTITVTIFF